MVTPLNEPEEVLAFLAEPIRAVYDALDHGFSLAQTFFEDRERDPFLWAHLVRYGARTVLGDGGESWRVRQLANSGLEIIQTPLVMRVLKCQDGGPPPPGASRARRAFWSQQGRQVSLPLEWGETQEPTFGANLILDWDPDFGTHAIDLSMSKTLTIWRYKGQPELAWRLPIGFDAEADQPRFVPAEEDVDVEPKFDTDELGEDGASE